MQRTHLFVSCSHSWGVSHINILIHSNINILIHMLITWYLNVYINILIWETPQELERETKRRVRCITVLNIYVCNIMLASQRQKTGARTHCIGRGAAAVAQSARAPPCFSLSPPSCSLPPPHFYLAQLLFFLYLGCRKPLERQYSGWGRRAAGREHLVARCQAR